jgi:hypothetical protein
MLAATQLTICPKLEQKMKRIIGWTILIVVGIFVIQFIRSCNDGFGYRAGSGLGSLVDIGGEKYKHSYLRQYADTFFILYPQYKVPANDPTAYLTSGYEFLNLTKFYFDEEPREIYCVQWEGTGFISVRFAYSYATGKAVVENERDKVYVDEEDKQRMTKRLRTEILDRIDSIIDKSVDRDSAIFVLPF